MRALIPLLLCAGCSSDPGTLPNPTSGGASSDAGDAASPDGSTPIDSSNPGMPPAPTASGCQAMTHDTAKVENSAADTYGWSDRACRPRSASLFRNDAKDAFGEYGGYLRSIAYEQNGKTRNCRGTGVNGWQGFGYVINHFANGASETQGVSGSTTVLLAGKHHAVHQFKWRVNPGAPVDATAEWRVATGRDHPLFAITFDSTPAGKNVPNADTRAPYGDMAFEGGTTGSISGIGWGDAHKFTTTGNGPVTTTSAWDYTQPNTIPYDVSWSNGADAEMGLVATHVFATGPSAGDYGGGILAQHWGKTGTSLLADLPDWTWPYQLNQYELPFGTTSHRVAWGANYGAVGQASYTSFARNLSGYPFASYAVEVVFGAHASSAVMAAVAEMETVMKTTASGDISTSGAGGPGRTDVVTFAHPGWDAVRGAWSADAKANVATIGFDTMGATLVNPLVVIRNWTAGDPHVAWNGAALAADVHYFATVDAARKELWITANFAVTKGSLDVSP